MTVKGMPLAKGTGGLDLGDDCAEALSSVAAKEEGEALQQGAARGLSSKARGDLAFCSTAHCVLMAVGFLQRTENPPTLQQSTGASTLCCSESPWVVGSGVLDHTLQEDGLTTVFLGGDSLPEALLAWGLVC